MVDDFKSRGGSPWGSPSGGGGNGSGRGPRPPDVEEIIKKIQETINKILPGGGSGGGKIVATGTPEQIAKSKTSLTGKFLKASLSH